MSAPRTDVASSIKVGDLFTLESLSFDANAANDFIAKCATCVDCEDLCDILEEILDTLSDPDTPNTSERLRLVNLIQWTALECSRKSIRLQNKEFKDYVRDNERLNRIPTALAPASQPKRQQAKRHTASPRKVVPSKKRRNRSDRSQPTPLPHLIAETLSLLWKRGKRQPMRAGKRSALRKTDKPVIAPSSPAVAAAAGSVGAPGSIKDNDGFYFGRP
ncbi:hypothetical protein TNCV_4561701 [Trichonephila clavipes]|nr:hypothetical protein TNCV_4561701 [Trichonephila clavipes]